MPTDDRPLVGRLAPTPSGHLHLGNALAFGAAWILARQTGAELLLRIEDLDRGRSRPEIADAQRRDLEWLGLHWDREVTPQSQRSYSVQGLPVYLCDCSRKQRLAGACTHREHPAAEGAVRLIASPEPVAFVDQAWGPQAFRIASDPVLIRKGGEPGYPLAVVQDDLLDGVTQVVRGADLLEPTAVQVQIYRALGQPLPTFLHTPLLLGPDGRKLSKSHGASELRSLRERGVEPSRIWAFLLPLLGVSGPLSGAVLAVEDMPTQTFTVDPEALELLPGPT